MAREKKTSEEQRDFQLILGTAIDSSPSMAFVRKINVSTKVFLRRLPGEEGGEDGKDRKDGKKRSNEVRGVE